MVDIPSTQPANQYSHLTVILSHSKDKRSHGKFFEYEMDLHTQLKVIFYGGHYKYSPQASQASEHSPAFLLFLAQQGRAIWEIYHCLIGIN